jgi:fructose-bisphosphate aldolase class II
MPLVSILDELRKAQQAQYAVPCFDTFEMMGTQGIVAALEEKRAPGIIGLYSGIFDRPNARAITALVRTMAEDATVPISLILDHGKDFEHCMQALHFGFSDVMYDGSKLPLEENIANTRAIVRVAHAIGAAVEAELGHVGVGREYQSFGAQGKGFTEPEAVEHFVAETGVDFLAVAVGTAHGLYEGEPQLALDLLEQIRERVEIPLVLHGGSGLSDEQFRSSIERGIAKINIFTNLSVAAGKGMIEAAQGEDASYFSIIRAVSTAFQRECERLLDVFGASGRA